MPVKLPKQWRHWCAGQKLRPVFSGNKSWWNWIDLKGRGYRWRIVSTKNGGFQIGDTYEEFNRWARCTIVEVPMPRSKKEFDATVKALLNLRKDMV